MRYADAGRLLGRELVSDRATLATLADVQDAAWATGMALNVWLAGMGV